MTLDFEKDLRRDDRQFQPIKAPLRSNAEARMPDTSRAVIQQFHVDKAPRYAPQEVGGRTRTFCNIFVWDWSTAMGAELPHFVDGKEQVINQTIMRLREDKEAGWMKCHPDDAHAYAKTGMPAIATWYNPKGGPGHVAVIVPERALTVAQAGRICGYGLTLNAAFGAQRVPFLEYWFHV